MLSRATLTCANAAFLLLAITTGLPAQPGAALQRASEVEPARLGKLEFFARPASGRVPEGRFGTQVCDTTHLVVRYHADGGHALRQVRFRRCLSGRWLDLGERRWRNVRPGVQEAVWRWDTEPEKNKPYEWQAVCLVAGRDGSLSWVTRRGTWKPRNTVLHSSFEMLINRTAGDGPHRMTWNITHLQDTGLRIDPHYTVTVEIRPVREQAEPVATLVRYNVPVGDGRVEWNPDAGSEPVASGIYTYVIRVVACCHDSWPLPRSFGAIHTYIASEVPPDSVRLVVQYELLADWHTGTVKVFALRSGAWVAAGQIALSAKGLKRGKHLTPVFTATAAANERLWTTIVGTGY